MIACLDFPGIFHRNVQRMDLGRENDPGVGLGTICVFVKNDLCFCEELIHVFLGTDLSSSSRNDLRLCEELIPTLLGTDPGLGRAYPRRREGDAGAGTL